MATTTISNLPALTPASGTVVYAENSSQSGKIDVDNVSNYALTSYNGATLAGSVQTPKAAIDGLNTKIGSTTMGTTATTITGAIAEHESDISTLNSNLVPAETYSISGVSTSYDSSHILTWKGKLIGHTNTPSSKFVVVIQTNPTVGATSVFSITLDTSSNIAINKISGEDNISMLSTNSYHNPYPITTSSSGWTLFITIFKTF